MSDFFKAKKPKTKSNETGPSKPPVIIPWVEKYRPKSVDDVAHQEEVVSVLRNTVKGNDFPNLLFYGPPGTGKTSTILAVAKQLFGNDLYRSRVLELNASDERGIQVIRDKVKTFANQAVSAQKPDCMVSAAFYPSKVDEPMFADFWTLLVLLGTPCLVVVEKLEQSWNILDLTACDSFVTTVIFKKVSLPFITNNGTPCPPFKIVVLDEADSMTTHAQAALRRTMEKQSKTTRFCLICNYVSRIIEPITSRCAKFRFKQLPKETLVDRLKLIAQRENVNITNEALDELIDASEGDMRKAITYLQSAHRLKTDEEINQTDIIEMAGVIPSQLLDSLLQECYSNSFEKLDKKVKELIREGYSASQFITQLHDKLVLMESINDNKKSVIMEKLATADKCLCDGADEYLQIMATCTIVMEQVCRR